MSERMIPANAATSCLVGVAHDAGLIEEPLPTYCSEDRVLIYHGYATPSVACGAHSQNMDAVSRARKALRYDSETQSPEEP